MKHVLLCIITICSFICNTGNGQVFIKTVQTPQVRDRGVFNRSNRFAEIRLSETDKEASIIKETRISKNNLGRFDHKFETLLSPIKNAVWEEDSKFSITRIKISVPRVPTLRIYFSKLRLPESTEMYIYTNTTTLGPITHKDSTRAGQHWGTCVFPDSSVIIEIKVPSKLREKIELDICSIMFGFGKDESLPKRNKGDSLLIEYDDFGESGSCNINALCSAGSGYTHERAGIAKILTESNGRASGFMVNDVCNSMTPYFMTAHHVSSGNNPSSWQFIFHYWSPTCSPNVDGSTSLLFNGASLLSTWDHSDFSLLQLYDTPPVSAGISYLGWSRSTSAPSTSIGLHHPRGDVMKISVENDAAVIADVSGYTNTGWRVQFDAGTAEPGSSGSPLINSSNQVVGICSSGTNTDDYCSGIYVYYGRFDLAWDGGGTSGTRIKDWLDPSNTGATSMTTFDPNAVLPLSGVDKFCSGTQTYVLGTPPSGFSLSSWTIEPASSIVVSMATSGGTVSLTYVSDGVVTLTAKVLNPCNDTIRVQKTIGVGGPAISFYIDPLWYTQNHTFCTNSFGNNFEVISGPLANVTAFEWGISPSTVIDANGWLEELGVPFSTGGYYQIYARAKNSCGYGSSGTATLNIYVDDNCSGGLAIKNKVTMKSITPESSNGFIIYPNPAGNTLYVTTPDDIDIRHSLLRIIDISGREVKRNISLSKSQTEVNIGMLSKGNYLIEITDGKKKYSKKLIKK